MYKNGVEVIKRKKPCVLRWVHFDKETDSEKYYREHLMLFIPWRNEEKDLIKTFASFEESFQSCRLQVEKKLKEYQKREININDVEQMLHCMDDNACSEYIAPGCEHQDEIDKEEGNTLSEKYGCFDPGKHAPEYDIGLDIGIVRKQLEEDISQLGEMDDYSYRKMVRSLNEQQKEFFNHVMHWLKTRISPLYVFLTGGAGVGKSVVTRALYQGLLKFYSHQLNESPDTFHVLLCAPTGKAAHNINGATIHSSFCIPVGQGFAYKPLDMQQLNTLRTKYMHLKVLIIDEISMVGQNMFNFVNFRLQEIRGCPKPFGGVSVITVGDLYQLKPVMDKWIFSQSERDYGPLGANLWKDNFHMYELTKIMRQKDDKDFAELLNRLREGKHNADDINVFKMHVTEDDAELSDIPHLYTTRKEVEMYNTRVYDIAQVNMKIEIQAIDWVIGTSDSKIQSRVLDRIPVENSKTMGLSTKLKLVLNIPAEITNNVDVQDGITNGASCIVKHFDFRVEGSNRCSIIWVEFTEKEIGKAMRTKLARLFKPDISKTWTPILEITRIFKIHMNGTYQVKRKQFPLQLSAAKTIHKSQGSTLTDAVVHLGTRKNEHMHYVGFSRVVCLKNLHILHLNENKISVSTYVQEEMDRLRQECMLQLCVRNLQDNLSQGSIVSFFNARSLRLHILDLREDTSILPSDIIFISETRLMAGDDDNSLEIQDFTLHRNDFPNTDGNRPSYGLAVYLKDTILSKVRNVKKSSFGRIQVLSVNIAVGELVSLIFLYIPPQEKSNEVKKSLRNIIKIHASNPNAIVLAGDFNVDNSKSDTFAKYMLKEFNLRYLQTGSTTDYDSTLDHIYTNILPIQINFWGTLESYYSDHKPIYVSLE